MSDLSITTDFSKTDYQTWKQAVEAGLKGADFDTLIRKTDDDIQRGPLFTLKDRPETIAPLRRQKAPLLDGRPWHICSPVRDPDLSFANQQLLEDLRGGASAVELTIGKPALQLRNKADLKRLFEGVFLELVPVTVTFADIGISDMQRSVALLSAFEGFKNTPLTLGFDPIGSYYQNVDQEPDFPLLENNMTENTITLTVNAAQIHNCGGTEAQELSYLAAAAAFYWRHYGPETKLSARIVCDQDAHLTIAKFRAARLILSQVAQAFNIDTTVPVHAVTSHRMMQKIDPWTNLLRVMSSGFGAICGGAEFITLRPFTDAPSETPRHATPFSYRIARNMQMMMMEECHLGQVQDPTFGSYFHEKLTHELAKTTWTEFQAIESGGGLPDLLQNGIFQKAISAAAAERITKADPILGVTLHPSKNGRPAPLRGEV